MKRIIVICEGPTEKEFCEKSLFPHFISKNIIIEYPLIKKSSGGIIKWSEIKRQIGNHLKQDTTAYVTMLIDYYGMYKKHEFPEWESSLKEADKNLRMDLLEKAMKDSIDAELRYRFIPYLQLHEFEGLLFNNIETFKSQIPANEITNIKELEGILTSYPNPEMINDMPETAPSKRLIKLISGYRKVVYGNILAEVIGLERIKNKCPRFNFWISKLESI
ncbi:MAG: hypothetical protein JWQ09_4596 [Segetibacter sp.]|nr:hypothetical protein [Segetibacter sp.]